MDPFAELPTNIDSMLRHSYSVLSTGFKTVIPAQAGIQSCKLTRITWIPACAGMTYD